MTPRSCLRWKPTGRIFKTIGLRWVPTGKIFAFSTNKVDSEPPNGSKGDITNQCESEQALDVSAGTLLSTVQASVVNVKWCLLKITLQAPFLNVQMTSVHISSGLVLHQMTSDHNRSELGIQDHSNEPSSSKLVPKVVPLENKTATSRQKLELLFHLHISMLRTTVKCEERFLKIKQAMREEQNQPGVIQELLLKLMDDLQILKGSQQEKKETTAQSFIPYWNFSMINDEEARDNFLKDVCTFLRKFSRIPFGVTPKVILIAWESFGKIKDALMDKQYQQEDIQELMSKLLEDVRNISEEFSEYINCPSWNRPLFYFDDDDDEYTVIWRRPKAITPDEPSEEPEDPIIIGEEELSTIP
ncbi:hypothetical protein Tco_0928474 [Tanacetum coccineum]